ncbi:unnamed protein product, partial [Musa banksii]
QSIPSPPFLPVPEQRKDILLFRNPNFGRLRRSSGGLGLPSLSIRRHGSMR